jgi:hypothetical protein
MMIVDIGGELILETTNLHMPGRMVCIYQCPVTMTSDSIPLPGLAAWPGPRPTMPRKPTQPAYTTHISGTTDVRKDEKSVFVQLPTLRMIGFSLRFVA